MKNGRVCFGVIGLDHSHVYLQARSLINAGAELKSFWASEPDHIAEFSKAYPGVPLARSKQEVLEDPEIDLITSASIPYQRAPLGVEVMKHGKDFLVDKPGVTTMEQMKEVRKVQEETKRIYLVYYAERFDERSCIKAGEIVKGGAIGKVIQTVGLGPHQIGLSHRPKWFYEKEKYGGILVDICSHQFDQFLYFTGSTEAKVVVSQIGNFHHPQYPELEDFGDVVLSGDGGTGYARVDWFTPDGLGTWGDGRLIILGTDGYIELRKNCDIAGRPGGDHLFLVDQKGIEYIDCKDVQLDFGKRFVHDVINRTETAMPQDQCFLATELAILAETNAIRIAG